MTITLAKIEFVEELPRSSRGMPRKKLNERDKFAKLLSEHPGRWAKWPFKMKSVKTGYALAQSIKAGKLTAFRGYEAAVRGGELFVRYNPNPEPKAPKAAAKKATSRRTAASKG